MSNASDKIWYVRKGIKKLGPFSNAEMRGLASSGKLVPEDMIWKDGLDGWVKASRLKVAFSVQSVQVEPLHPTNETEHEALSMSKSNTVDKKTKTCTFCGEEILAIAKKCKYCASLLDGSSGGASHSEEILADKVANLIRGIEAVGGRLKITSRRVIFESHKINLQTMPAEILMSDILEVQKRNTLGLVPNGLLIRTKAGVEYKFVVWGRENLINIIESRINKS